MVPITGWGIDPKYMIHATRMENITQVQVGVRLLLSGLTGIQFRVRALGTCSEGVCLSVTWFETSYVSVKGALGVGPKQVITRVTIVGM